MHVRVRVYVCVRARACVCLCACVCVCFLNIYPNIIFTAKYLSDLHKSSVVNRYFGVRCIYMYFLRGNLKYIVFIFECSHVFFFFFFVFVFFFVFFWGGGGGGFR